MKKHVTLKQYISRRNGVPLGAPNSLSQNLTRSLGAGSFAEFWQIWNPIWGYYLARLVFVPLKRWLPSPVALLSTFAVSGFLHDVAVMAIKWKPIFFFTPWFLLMGLLVVVSAALNIRYQRFSWPFRAAINIATIVGSFVLVDSLL